MRRLTIALFLLACPAFYQQTYVGRFDAYAGYMFLDSPNIKLDENGFQMQVGVRPKTWYSLGFDYSISTGNTALTSNLFTTALQQQLGAQLAVLAGAGLVSASYTPSVPISSKTETFAAGPQLAYRHWSLVTLFIRPSIGAIHETATLHAADPITAALAAQLAPSGKKEDWAGFYGFGGGVDVNVSSHFAVRVQADFVHDHLFSDLLKNGRNTVRFSVGPAFQFGGNVVK